MAYRVNVGGLRYHDYMSGQSSLLGRAGIEHGFTTRGAGDYRSAPLPVSVALARQVHGVAVLEATAPGRQAVAADIVVARRGRGAGVLTADCVPILLVDPQAGLAAAVHAGWKGTLANAVGGAAAALETRGANLGHLLAALGPCIRACCYEVSPELLSSFVHAFGPGVATGSGHLDLVAATVQHLSNLGIPPAQIDDVGGCTRCDREGELYRYFSYRRERELAGRQLSWLRLSCARPGP